MNSVVFFDIDNVLIRGQSQKLFLRFLISQKKIKLSKFIYIYIWFVFYNFGLCKDVISIRKFAFKVFQGWSTDVMSDVVMNFYNQILLPKLNYKLIDKLRIHQARGDVVVLLSATLKEIAEHLGRALKVQYVIATELEIVDHRYTGLMIGKIPYGENKVEFLKDFVLKNNLDLKRSYAYADHFSDLMMLQLVTNPIVVNPDAKLKLFANKYGWEILKDGSEF